MPMYDAKDTLPRLNRFMQTLSKGQRNAKGERVPWGLTDLEIGTGDGTPISVFFSVPSHPKPFRLDLYTGRIGEIDTFTGFCLDNDDTRHLEKVLGTRA